MSPLSKIICKLASIVNENSKQLFELNYIVKEICHTKLDFAGSKHFYKNVYQGTFYSSFLPTWMSPQHVLGGGTTPGGIYSLLVSDVHLPYGGDSSHRVQLVAFIALSRVNNFFTVMDFLSSWPLLKEGRSFDKMRTFSRPPTQQEKIEYIKSVSSLK